MSFAAQTGNAIQYSLRETSTAWSEEHKHRNTTLHLNYAFYTLHSTNLHATDECNRECKSSK